jgi:hypothetical protein
MVVIRKGKSESWNSVVNRMANPSQRPAALLLFQENLRIGMPEKEAAFESLVLMCAYK